MAMIGKIEKERRKIFESTSITVDPVISYTEADFKFNEEPEKK